ncbi:hypothetical protein T4A_5117, partial [Trichinella pseudospiralis]
LWFILVEEDELPFLCFVQASEGKVPFTTMRERTSRAMGKASFQTHFNITVIICAPRFACFTATVNFIKGFQSELEDEMKILNIKVDGVLNSTLEGFPLNAQKTTKLICMFDVPNGCCHCGQMLGDGAENCNCWFMATSQSTCSFRMNFSVYAGEMLRVMAAL